MEVFDVVTTLGGMLMALIWFSFVIMNVVAGLNNHHVVWSFAHYGVRGLSFLYAFDRRSSMLLPFFDQEGAEIKDHAIDYVEWTKSRPFPTKVEMHFRYESAENTMTNGKMPRHEFVYMRAQVKLPAPLPDGLSIGVVPRTQEAELRARLDDCVRRQSFDPVQETHQSTLWLRCHDRGKEREVSATIDDIVLFLMPLDMLALSYAQEQVAKGQLKGQLKGESQGQMVSVRQTPTAMTIYDSLAPKLNTSHGHMRYREHVKERLCWLECEGDTLVVEFLGGCYVKASASNARDMVDRWLRFTDERAVQFRGNVTGSLLDYAIARARHEESPIAAREFAIRFALNAFDLKNRYDSAPLKAIEACVRTIEHEIDLDTLLPLLSFDYLGGYTDEELEQLTYQSTHISVVNALVERSSELEVLHNWRVNWEDREALLKKRMMMKLSFVKQGEEIVAGMDDRGFVEVMRLFVLNGWSKLWEQEWVTALISERVNRVQDSVFHERVYQPVQKSQTYDADQRKNLSQYRTILDRVYQRYLFDVEDRVEQRERLYRVPVPLLSTLMVRGDERDYNAPGWQALFERLNELEVINLFYTSGLMEREQLELMMQFVEHEPLYNLVEQNASVRAGLIGVFELASVASRSVDSAALDRMVEHLFCGDAEFFGTSKYTDSWEKNIKLYLRYVEEQGARPTALRALNVIHQQVPSKQQKVVEPMIKKWADDLAGRRGVSGALTDVSGQEPKRGGLTVDSRE